MLTVVIDTTVLGADWLLQGPAAAFMVAESSGKRLRLIVPELVVREAVNLYRREFKASERQMRKAVQNHQRLSVGVLDSQMTSTLTAMDSDQAAIYEERLCGLLEKAGAVIAPLPEVSHDELIARALSGQRPFDSHGHKGYRDALIWHTVLEAVREHGRVIFISANASDFAASKQDPNTLASGLLKDIDSMRETGSVDAQVDLRSKPSIFVQMDCPSEEKSLIALRERLKWDRSFRVRVVEQLDCSWTTSWPDWEVEGDIGIEWEDNDLDMVGDVRDFKVDFTSAADERTFVKLSGHADIQVAYTVRSSSAWFDDPPEILDDIDWNDRSDTGRYVDVVPAALEFEAFYEPEASELGDVKLTKVTEAWDWVEEGRVLGGRVDRSSP